MDRRLLILLVLGGVVILAACTAPSPKPGEATPTKAPTPAATPAKTPTPVAKVATDCSKLQGLAKDKCISLAAQKAKDAKQCDSIANKGVKVDCKAKVAKEAKKAQAAVKPQPVPCQNERGAKKDTCYRLLAVKTESEAHCQKIADAKAKQQCTLDVNKMKKAKTAVPCADKTGAAKDTCYYVLALNSKKADSCGKIANNTLKDQCLRKIGILTNKPEVAASIASPAKKDSLATSIAVKKKDPAECGKVLDADRRAVCTAIVKEDANACQTMARVRAGQCFYGIALAKNDPTLCAKTRSVNQQWTCYETLAIQTQNEKLCDNTYFERRTRCLNSVAQAKKFGSAPTPTPVVPL